MEPGTLLLGLVILASLRGSSSGPPSPSPKPGPGPGPSPGGAQPMIRTFTGDAATWAKDRYARAVKMIQASNLPGVPDEEAIALSVLAHWGIETAWGSAEYNNNLGGIHAWPGQTYFASTDAGKPTRFASYASIDEGMHAYRDLLVKSYRDCLIKLVSSPEDPGWFACLGSKGYYGGKPDYPTARTKAAGLIAGG